MDKRFEELLAGLLDDELSEVELSELTELVRNDSSRQAELQSQLEAAELLVLAQDELHTPERFLAGLRTANKAVPDGFAPFADVQKSKSSSFLSIAPVAIAAALILVFVFWISARSANSIATIRSVQGEVLWMGDGGSLSEPRPGQRITGGTIKTLSADAWSVVEFLDGSAITVVGQSEMTLAKDDEGRKVVTLNHGAVSADVERQPKDLPMIVRTPAAEIEVLGTQFNVDAEPLQTRLAVNEGLVRLMRLSDGETVDVAAEHQVVASIDQPEKLQAKPRGTAAFTWKSDVKSDMRHGIWVSDIELLAKKLNAAVKRGELTSAAAMKEYKAAVTFSDSGSVCATPFQESKWKLTSRSLILLTVTNRSRPTIITEDSTFRIRGTFDGSPDGSFTLGISTNHRSGGFDGKYVSEVSVTESGESFDVEIPLRAFRQVDTQLGMPPGQKELTAVWCVADGSNTKLRVSVAELLPGSAE